MIKESPVISPSPNLLSRLKQISPALFALDRQPIIPEEYQFPIEEFAAALAKQFELEVSIETVDTNWIEHADLKKESLENKLDIIGCSLFGIDPPFSLLYPKETIPNLLSALLHITPAEANSQGEPFIKAFQAFFFAQVLALVKQCCQWNKMELRLVDQDSLIDCKGFFLHRYTVTIGSFSFTVLAALPNQFLDKLHELPQRKSQTQKKIFPSTPLIPISIEAARSHMPLSVLKTIQHGDVVVVDFPFFIPGSDRARVILTYRGIPLFRAKVKNGVIKLLEMAQNQQAFRPISQTTQDASGYPTHENPMVQMKPPIPTAPLKKAAPALPSGESKDEEFSEETLEVNEPGKSSKTQEQTVTTSPTTQPIHLNELPLIVVVQLKELTMTLEQLSSLQPGNLLDLDIHPEQTTVQLVVEGHTIAEGDLIAIGEKIGVRIRVINK